jgi:hypothetical protein
MFKVIFVESKVGMLFFSHLGGTNSINVRAIVLFTKTFSYYIALNCMHGVT